MRHSVDKVLITTHLEHMVVTKMYWHAGYSHTIIIILTKKTTKRQTFKCTAQTQTALSASSNVTFFPQRGATACANPLRILKQT